MQTAHSYTKTLPNGNKVTVKVSTARNGASIKTVTVRRPNGTSESRTTRRNPVLSYFSNGQNESIPAWAQR